MPKRIRPGGPFFRSGIGESPPTGVVGPAEYQWGTHAQAIHSAEGVKSRIFPSVAAAAVAAAASIPPLIFTPQQAYSNDNVSAISIVPVEPTVESAVPPLFRALQQVNPTQILASIFDPTPAQQGGVPRTIVVGPQFDPNQLQPEVIPAQPTAVVVTNPLGGFFTVPPQLEERETRVVWESQVVGAAPFVSPIIWGAPQLYDSTQQGSIAQPLPAPPPTSYATLVLYAAPQFVDLTQQGWILGSAPVQQGGVPPSIFASQVDPSQLAAQIFPSVSLRELVFGSVPALVTNAREAQFNPYQIPATLRRPLEFSVPPVPSDKLLLDLHTGRLYIRITGKYIIPLT